MRDVSVIHNQMAEHANIASKNNEILVQISFDMEQRLFFLSNTTSVPPLAEALVSLFTETLRGNPICGQSAEAFLKAVMFAVQYVKDTNNTELAKYQRYQDFKNGKLEDISSNEIDEFLDRILEERKQSELPTVFIHFYKDRIVLKSLLKSTLLEFGLVVTCDSFKLYKGDNDFYYLEFDYDKDICQQISDHVGCNKGKHFKICYE